MKHASSAAVLEIDDLAVGLGDRELLSAVTLRLDRGDVVLIVGANGVGKTMLLDVVSGLFPSQGGRVRLLGRDVTRASSNVRASRGLGRLFQSGGVFADLSVGENLSLALSTPLARSAVRSWLWGSSSRRTWAENATCCRFLEKSGLSEDTSKLVCRLSHGQQRFVAVLCAFLRNPAALLLDEPFAGLSPEYRVAVAQLAEEFASGGGALLVVEHEEVERQVAASWTVRLQDGRLRPDRTGHVEDVNDAL